MKFIVPVVLALSLFEARADPLHRLTVLPTGQQSTALALDPIRSRVYVITSEKNPEIRKTCQGYILVYDASTLKPVRRLQWSHGDTPLRIAVDPGTGNLYVFQENGNALYVVAPLTGGDLATIPLPDRLYHMTASWRLPRLYLSLPDAVGVVDTRANTLIGTLPAPSAVGSPAAEDPWVGLAFVAGMNQRLLALDLASRRCRWNTNVGDARWSRFAPLGTPVVDSSRHRLYFMQPWPHNRVLVYDTRSLRRVAAIQTNGDLVDIAVDEGLGQVYVLSVSPPAIRIMDAATLRLRSTLKRDLVFDPSTIQVDSRTHRVFVRSETLGDCGVYEPTLGDLRVTRDRGSRHSGMTR
jgi:DNA-binding beta-propeller fold protein YncE